MGVDGFSPNDLRHYAASVLIDQGASVKAVQRHLGHASATTTLDTYAHLWPDSEDVTRRALAVGLEGFDGFDVGDAVVDKSRWAACRHPSQRLTKSVASGT